MRLKPKATVHQRQRTGPPAIRVFLAEEAAHRRRETPPRPDPAPQLRNDLAAALVGRRRGEKRKEREL
jgi:hypothetical protein